MTGMISGMDTTLQELIQKLISELLPTIFTLQANCSLKNYLIKQWQPIKSSKFWKQTITYLISWESINITMPLVELLNNQSQMIILWDFSKDWQKVMFNMVKSLEIKLKKKLESKFKIQTGALAQELMQHI